MPEEDSILNLYLRVHKELVKNLKQSVEPYEFNRGELPILVKLIKGGDGVSQKEIRESLPISKSTTSKTVDNLVRKGYLRKERDSEDRRVTLIYLTDKGREIEDVIKDVEKRAGKRMLENFSEEERDRLAMYLERSLEGLKD